MLPYLKRDNFIDYLQRWLWDNPYEWWDWTDLRNFRAIEDWCLGSLQYPLNVKPFERIGDYMSYTNNWTFANVRMTKADLPRLREFMQNYDDDPVAAILDVLGSGYKVSISWLDEQQSFVVTLTGTERSKHNQQTSMTTWSDDLQEAFAMAAFKHFVLCEAQEWQDYENASQNWG